MPKGFFVSINPLELQDLLANKAFWKILDIVPNAVQVVKAVRNKQNEVIDFKYLFVNDAAEHTRKKLIGKSLLLEFPHSRENGLFEKLVQTIEEQSEGVVLFARDLYHKEELCLDDEQKTFLHELKEHEIPGLNKSLITKNRKLEFLYSELNTFNSVVANNYNEILRLLYTNLEFIVSKEARNLTDGGKASIRRAQVAIQKLKLMTDDVITFSGTHAAENEITDVNLNEILLNVLQDLGEKVSLVNVNIDTLPVIKGYPSLLGLLFYHLIDNAIKFGRKEIPIEIRVSYNEVNTPRLAMEENPGTWFYKVYVTDNGIGFDQSKSEKIFMMFYRLNDKSKYKGTGIGLAICKKIMDIHDGLIGANGVEGKGSTFELFFQA